MASEWLPHPLGDHGVLLGHMHITKDALQRMIVEHCRAELAGYKKPKRVFFVEALPRNAMGKVQKQALADGFARN